MNRDFLLKTMLSLVMIICGTLYLRRDEKKRFAFFPLLLSAVLIAVLIYPAQMAGSTVASKMEPTSEVLRITALDQRNEKAKENTIYLTGLFANGKKVQIETATDASWYWQNNWYVWRAPEDSKNPGGLSQSIELLLPAGKDRKITFLGNEFKGLVKIEYADSEQILDCYSPEKKTLQVFLEDSPPEILEKDALLRLCVSMLLTLELSLLLIAAADRVLHSRLRRLWSKNTLRKLKNHQFLFEELVKRDFKKKYKRTALGMAWSILSPLLTLLVMRLVFTQFFGRNTPHFTTYLFCGNLVFSFFSESTNQGMSSLMGNSGIFTKVNLPKYLFLLAKNVQCLLNFGLTLCVFFVFCVIDHITFTWRIVLLIYPILCLVIFNIGVGLILSALYVFFRDVQYLWSVFTRLLLYMSAIFYTVDKYPPQVQRAFFANPIYVYIRYFRLIVIDMSIPSPQYHLLMAAYALFFFVIGAWMYVKYNHRFLYYV